MGIMSKVKGAKKDAEGKKAEMAAAAAAEAAAQDTSSKPAYRHVPIHAARDAMSIHSGQNEEHREEIRRANRDRMSRTQSEYSFGAASPRMSGTGNPFISRASSQMSMDYAAGSPDFSRASSSQSIPRMMQQYNGPPVPMIPMQYMPQAAAAGPSYSRESSFANQPQQSLQRPRVSRNYTSGASPLGRSPVISIESHPESDEEHQENQSTASSSASEEIELQTRHYDPNTLARLQQPGQYTRNVGGMSLTPNVAAPPPAAQRREPRYFKAPEPTVAPVLPAPVVESPKKKSRFNFMKRGGQAVAAH